jgi:isoamylase
LKACCQDPLLASVKLIAEPWDCGPGGYQVGGFPPGWAEWNDKFRDTVRDFWRGEAPAAALTPRLGASGELFNYGGRRAWACVNFVTAHDGFTLNDTVSYNDKHNVANGEDNQDGSSDNHSWNCGADGPTDYPEINQLREHQIRNMLATLILSQGTPMLLAGDEFGRTQDGNNNAYCQDSEISWLNWEVDQKGRSLLGFTQKLTRLRHKYPMLRRARFLTGEIKIPAASCGVLVVERKQIRRTQRAAGNMSRKRFNEEFGVKDVTWINANGAELQEGEWDDACMKCFGMLMDGRAQERRRAQARTGRNLAAADQQLSGYGGIRLARGVGRRAMDTACRYKRAGRRRGADLCVRG